METGLSASHSAAGSVVEPAAADPDGYDPSATVDDATADDATAAADYDRSSAHSDSSSPPPSPLSPSSSPLSHYLITTPYPIVESSPSLIDVARSTVHASLPPTPSLRSFRSLPVHTQSPAHSPELSPALSYAHPYTPPRWSSLTYNPMSAYPSTSPLPLPPPRSSPGPSHELQDFSLGSAPIFLSSPLPPPRDEDNATGLRHEEEVDNESQQQRQYDQASDRPRSVIDMAIDTANISEAGRTVRRNALEQRVTWSHIPRNARFFLILNGLMTLIKIASTTAVLVVDRDAPCLNFKVLLTLYAIRAAIEFPFNVYAHMHPRQPGAPLTARDILLERQKTLMEITGTCLFFLSNYFLFSHGDCRQKAPAVYYMTIAYVVLGYIVIMIPIVLCLAVVLCLPLVLRIMQALDIGPVVGVKGATEEMIAAIPIVKYRKPHVPTAESSSAAGSAGSVAVDMGETSEQDRIEEVNENSTSPSIAAGSSLGKTKGGLFKFMRRKNKSHAAQPTEGSSPHTSEEEYLTLDDPQDAVCAICLCDYEDDEELRKMKCGHYFHKDCVDEWLKLNRNCPLCKRDIEESAGGRRSMTLRSGTMSTIGRTSTGAASGVTEEAAAASASASASSPRATTTGRAATVAVAAVTAAAGSLSPSRQGPPRSATR